MIKFVKQSKQSTAAAFTLVELLVVIAVVSVLAVLVSSAGSFMRRQAMMTEEVAAAKELAAGLQLYAADNGNELLPGTDRSTRSVQLPGGKEMGGSIAYRYPWRLAPYVGNTVSGTFVLDVNKNDMAKPGQPNHEANAYHISLAPALGYNGTILGGAIHSIGDGTERKRRIEDEISIRANDPSAQRLIAFASAYYQRGPDMEGMKGFHLITPPGLTMPGVQAWAGNEWHEDIPSQQFGNVDLRHKEQAVVSRLDGSVELLDPEELKDMRNWSPVAYENDDPDHRITHSRRRR